MQTAPPATVAQRTPRLVGGLVAMGFGIALQVEAAMGLSPWTVFHQGVSLVTPLTIGTAGIVTGLCLLLLWIPLRQRVGIGTLGNVVLIGLSVDLSLLLIPTVTGWIVRAAFFLLGMVLVGFGSGLYIGARLGTGPRDGIMTGLSERGWMSVRVARTLLEAFALGVGWLLGGNVGVGTVLTVLGIGPLVQHFLERFDLGAREEAHP